MSLISEKYREKVWEALGAVPKPEGGRIVNTQLYHIGSQDVKEWIRENYIKEELFFPHLCFTEILTFETKGFLITYIVTYKSDDDIRLVELLKEAL